MDLKKLIQDYPYNTDFREQLVKFKNDDLKLCWEDLELEPDFLLEIYDFIKKEISCSLKQRQYAGIQRKLKEKANGNGDYGRPKIKLPANFDEKVMEYKSCHLSLASYFKELRMKKSTFYKYVKYVLAGSEKDSVI